jgi:dienelactone hydrolase
VLIKILYLIPSVALVALLTASHLDSSPIQKLEKSQPDESSATPGRIIEEVVQIPMVVKGVFKDTQILLEGTVFRQESGGPFPLVILSHGNSDPIKRRTNGRARFEKQSQEFVKRGFAVVIPMRRGYAKSEGDCTEDFSNRINVDLYEAGLEAARDLLATVRFMETQPYIDGSRLLLAGQSAGGFASLAAASQGVDGLLGVINFAGGRRPPGQPPQWQLSRAMEKFGRTTKVPTLWLYSETDSRFSPACVKEIHDAFQKGGGKAKLVMFPPFGKDGHYLFPNERGLPLWTKEVDKFLAEIGFPLKR